MIQGLIVKKVIDVVLKKIMAKHNLNKLQKYVEEENELDVKVKALEKKVKKQEIMINKNKGEILRLKKHNQKSVEYRCEKYREFMMYGWEKGWNEGMFFMLECLHGKKYISDKTLYEFTKLLLNKN